MADDDRAAAVVVVVVAAIAGNHGLRDTWWWCATVVGSNAPALAKLLSCKIVSARGPPASPSIWMRNKYRQKEP